MVNFSVCTSSIPASRKAATAHSTALAMAGDPVRRPPISSVSRRRFSANGDGPIALAIIFGAACAQADSSLSEQACELAAAARRMRASGSGSGAEICADTDMAASKSAARKPRKAHKAHKVRCRTICQSANRRAVRARFSIIAHRGFGSDHARLAAERTKSAMRATCHISLTS